MSDFSIFAQFKGHEQVVFAADPASGLRCIVAIHSTVLGPALGGTRFRPYVDEAAALADVMRLSNAMSLKNSCAGLNHGGGKAVIIGDPHALRSDDLFRAYGRVIEQIGGRYITACDVGTKPEDMSVVKTQTRFVTGAQLEDGGSGDSGILTAWGVFVGIRACLQRVFGDSSPTGRHVAIQGVGKVGARLARHLAEHGARLTLADVNHQAATALAEELDAQVVAPETIHAVPCDVFSPNALGAVLNDDSIPQLQCRIVAGGANNQLAESRHGAALAARDIWYAPDFVLNAGGVIQISDELLPGGFSEPRARAATERIGERISEIFTLAEQQGIDTESAAEHIALARIEAAR